MTVSLQTTHSISFLFPVPSFLSLVDSLASPPQTDTVFWARIMSTVFCAASIPNGLACLLVGAARSSKERASRRSACAAISSSRKDEIRAASAQGDSANLIASSWSDKVQSWAAISAFQSSRASSWSVKGKAGTVGFREPKISSRSSCSSFRDSGTEITAILTIFCDQQTNKWDFLHQVWWYYRKRSCIKLTSDVVNWMIGQSIAVVNWVEVRGSVEGRRRRGRGRGRGRKWKMAGWKWAPWGRYASRWDFTGNCISSLNVILSP